MPFRPLSHFFAFFRAVRVPKFFTSGRGCKDLAGRKELALALLICMLGVVASYLVADRVYERMPHIEDEVAYVWQARVIAHGQLTLPAPRHATSFLVPFVVESNGQRFGKYPLGWPALLAIGIKLGIRSWINPLLAGLGVWLTYRLGKRFFSAGVGLLAAGLTVTSPFFLMNSGSLLSHPFGLVLSAAFILAWLDLFDPRRKSIISNQPSSINNLQSKIRNHQSSILVWAAGLSLGTLVLTRPFTAVAVAVPFGLHGLILLVRGGRPNSGLSGGGPKRWFVPPLSGNWAVRRRVLAIGLIALALSGLYFAWQKAVTGDALENPYVLWWPYDKIGFGKGYGVLAQGHSLPQAVYNTQQSLKSGFHDLFGWGSENPLAPGYSWIFIPFGLWAATFDGKRLRVRLNRQAWMLALVFASLVIAYMAYWIGSELYGPRYYYEALYSVTLLSAAGIAYLAGWPVNDASGSSVGDDGSLPRGRAFSPKWTRGRKPPSPGLGKSGNSGLRQRPDSGGQTDLSLRAMIIGLVVVGLVAYNLVMYLPGRLKGMHGLYGVGRENLRQFPAPPPPALIIVHSDQWHFYGALLELEDPFLTSPDIFAWSVQPTIDAVLHNDFPGRAVYHYYEDEPGVLYQHPRDH